MPIEDITRAMGQLYMHNIALQAEVTRLKRELAVSLSGLAGNQQTDKEFVSDGYGR